MSLTLSVGAVTVALNSDLYWADEFSWSPVTQSAAYSITGALIVQQGERAAGRPITLQPDSDDGAWLTRAALDQLNTWKNTAGQVMTLTGLRGASRQVLFRHQDGAVDASPVVHFSDVDAADSYRVTLRLMEI